MFLTGKKKKNYTLLPTESFYYHVQLMLMNCKFQLLIFFIHKYTKVESVSIHKYNNQVNNIQFNQYI